MYKFPVQRLGMSDNQNSIMEPSGAAALASRLT